MGLSQPCLWNSQPHGRELQLTGWDNPNLRFKIPSLELGLSQPCLWNSQRLDRELQPTGWDNPNLRVGIPTRLGSLSNPVAFGWNAMAIWYVDNPVVAIENVNVEFICLVVIFVMISYISIE